jgi:hypothetical protein
MTKWKLAVLIPLGILQLSGSARGQETALDRLRGDEPAGKLKEVDLDAGKTSIAAPAPVTEVKERPVLKAASLQPDAPAVGVVDRAILEAELNQRVRDLDGCRATVPRNEGTKREESPAGLVVLRLTIDPEGRAKNTVVYQQQATSIELMKCMRRRMEGWAFTPPTGGPVVVEHTLRLQPVVAEAKESEGKAKEGKPVEAKTEPALKKAAERK